MDKRASFCVIPSSRLALLSTRKEQFPSPRKGEQHDWLPELSGTLQERCTSVSLHPEISKAEMCEMTKSREGGSGTTSISPAVGATMFPGPCSTSCLHHGRNQCPDGHFQLPADFSTEVCPPLVFTPMVINCPSFSLLPPHHTHSLGPLPVASPSLSGCASAGCQPVHVQAVSPITSLHCRVCI